MDRPENPDRRPSSSGEQAPSLLDRQLRALGPLRPEAELDARVRDAALAALSAGDASGPRWLVGVGQGVMAASVSAVVVAQLWWAVLAASRLYG